jgi:16S rRNA (adenine1518-N6/adenine1519-N6)-dimethyltransferase
MALRDLVSRYNIRFKKTLGQNLLLDENINRIMVEAAALGPQDDVVEVGAGLGALTDRLRQQARRVLAIEIDRAFMPCLEERFKDAANVVLFRGDILNHEVEDLVNEHLPNHGTLKLVSNLPYYITTPILFHFWECPLFFERMVIMVQEEVGVRMVAAVGTAEYSRLTIAANLYAEVDIVHKVPRTCFTPRPKVDSCIVRLRNRREPRYPGLETRFLLGLVGLAFTMRRKTLRNSVAKTPALGLAPATILEAFEEAGIDPGRRPQTVSLDEFAALARALQARGAMLKTAPRE